IVSVDGPTTVGSTVDSTDAWYASWTQTNTYTDVSIAAKLRFGPNNGTAYLTTAIGPGTTVADELATLSFTAPATSTLFHLFTLPVLGPGTYYLTLAGSDPFPGFAWMET